MAFAAGINPAQASQFQAVQAQALEGRLASVNQNISDASGAPSAEAEKAARKAAEEFEAVFLSQVFAPIFNTIETEGPFGGGQSEKVFRGILVEELGKSVAQNGGIGVADSVYREILRLQEV